MPERLPWPDRAQQPDNAGTTRTASTPAWPSANPEAAVVVPPRATAVPSETAATAPTQRDYHRQIIAKHGRAAWQRASGYTTRARAEAAIGWFKQVIAEGLR